MSIYIPTFSEILNVADGRGALSKAPDLWNGLVGAWPMQEGGGDKAFDVSGYGNHGTLTNMDKATDWVVTEKGRALDFDGVDDYVNVPSSSALDITGSVSVSCWTNGDGSSTAYNAIVAKNTIYTSGYGLHYYGRDVDVPSDSRGVEFWVRDAGGHDLVRLPQTASTFPVMTTWNHWVGIFAGNASGGNLYLYLNGNLVASKLGSDDAPGSNAVSLKIADAQSATDQEWRGLIGNPLIYSRALSPAEIQQLYADPWAMYTLRQEVFPAAAAARGGSPLGNIFSPLQGLAG